MINPDCLQGNDFLNKFAPLLQGMIDLGLTKEQAIKAVCTQQFVIDFAETPGWFVSAKSLPKGSKWSDGERYAKRSTNKSGGEAYTLLEADNNLYIKGFYCDYLYFRSEEGGETCVMKPPKKLLNKICVITGWKSIDPHEVTYKLKVTPFFSNSYYSFCRNHGVRLGMSVPVLKNQKGGDA